MNTSIFINTFFFLILGECNVQAIAIRHPAEWQGMDVEATKKHPTLTNRSDIVEEKVIVRGTNEMNLKRLKKVKGIVSRLGAVSINTKSVSHLF